MGFNSFLWYKTLETAVEGDKVIQDFGSKGDVHWPSSTAVSRVILLLLISLLPGFVTAYAPLISKGERLITVTYSRFETEHFFNREGSVRKSYNHFSRDQLELVFELGLSSRNNLSLKGSLDLIKDHLNGDEGEFEDIEVGWKQALMSFNNAILSTELIAITPVDRYHPEVRYGRFGLEAALLWAQTFFPYGFKTTLDGRLAYRGYLGFPSDQLRVDLSAWIDLSCRWQLLWQNGIEYGLFNGKEPEDRSFFFYHANTRVWKVRLEAIYYISDRLAISVGYLQHILGQNTAVGGEGIARLSFCF